MGRVYFAIRLLRIECPRACVHVWSRWAGVNNFPGKLSTYPISRAWSAKTPSVGMYKWECLRPILTGYGVVFEIHSGRDMDVMLSEARFWKMGFSKSVWIQQLFGDAEPVPPPICFLGYGFRVTEEVTENLQECPGSPVYYSLKSYR